MKHTALAWIFVTALVFARSAAFGAEPSQDVRTVAFTHVTVVPMDRETLLSDWTVVIRGDRIEAMGPAATIETDPTAIVIEARGKYLMPGLADMHTHTWELEEFPVLLANGITTVRNMFGARIHLDWRARIADGTLAGPTIYTAGPIIDGKPPIWPSAVAENAQQARAIVAEQHELGYDFIKVYSRLSREAFDAALEEAKKRQLPVAGHVPTSISLSVALRSGMKSIEHLTGYESLARETGGPGEESFWARLDESRFADVARETAKSGVWNCPTLVVFQNRVAPAETALIRTLLARPETRYVSAETVKSWLPENNYLKNVDPARTSSSRQKGDVMRKRLVKALHDAGARLLLGTDYPNPFVIPGVSLHDELRNFVDAGLTPYEAIRAGTSDAAEFLGASAEFGTIAPGRRADLILIEGNPLEDVRNIRKRVGVMARGKWHAQTELDAALEALAKRFEAQGR